MPPRKRKKKAAVAKKEEGEEEPVEAEAEEPAAKKQETEAGEGGGGGAAEQHPSNPEGGSSLLLPVASHPMVRFLRAGDVVAFVKGDLPYLVHKGQSEEQPWVPSFTFAPDPGDLDFVGSPPAHLEVVRSGKWVGFRSRYADQRLLQVRRRGAQKLGFYSKQFGTWEQWEFVHSEPRRAWAELELQFRNRRLPGFKLAVRVKRVGAYSYASPAERSPLT